MDQLNGKELEIMEEIRSLIKTMDQGTYEEQESVKRTIHNLSELIYGYFDKKGSPVSFGRFMFLTLNPEYGEIARTIDKGNHCSILTTWKGITLRRKQDTARFFHSEINYDNTRYVLCHSRNQRAALEFHDGLVRRSKDRDADGGMCLDGLDYSIQEIYNNGNPMMKQIDQYMKNGGHREAMFRFDKMRRDDD